MRIPLMLVRGVEGPSVYLDDFRIAGNKPWGGGERIAQWSVDIAEVRRVLDAFESREGLREVLAEALEK